MKPRITLSGMQMLVGERWLKHKVLCVENGKIAGFQQVGREGFSVIDYHYPADHYLVPGFIDIHIHGAHNADVMDGTQEALGQIAKGLACEGVTGFLATTMTASDAHIEKILKIIPSTMANKKGAALLGVHLEGPFIAKEKSGAQVVKERVLDVSLVKHWQTLAQGAIKLMTIAPELAGMPVFVRDLAALGIQASAGHTNATYEVTCAAIEAGCRHATHLFNAMRNIHQREPGALGALLLADKVTAELIVDGFHLHPATVMLAWRLKGKDKLVLVTDAIRAKCVGDGDYAFSGQLVRVKSGKATLADGTLAGSTLQMPQAIKNMMRYTQCSLLDAIQMASKNPATLLGCADQKGSIEIGKDADLVILNPQLDVMLTLRKGEVIYKRKT